ncbi:MAG TPA: MBL fold metallo-hydrolase [Fimbriimonadaceae bacterium]|nr:MBL fold metallo-hydrolase [Fimbriimonadaceae bacterium]
MSGRRSVAIFGILAMLAAIAGLWIGAGRRAVTELVFLSVGQGDCVLIRHAGVTVMVDTGPRAGSFDAGKRIVLPALRRRGIRRIDLLILTHPDADHIGGLASIKGALDIQQLLVPAGFRNHDGLKFALQEADVRDSEVTYVEQATDIRIGNTSLHLDSRKWNLDDADNDGSMFVHLDINGATATFSGDAGGIAEMVIAGRYDWKAQLMMAGHHGSQTSTTQAWIDEVDPETAIISCGRNNSYGHPHPSVIERLEQNNIAILRTDRHGELRFFVEGGKFALQNAAIMR